MSGPLPTFFLIAALLWIAVCAYYGFSSAPALPLDSGTDAETIAALDAALQAHWLRTAVIAVIPPIVLFGFLKLIRR
jgi:hypothetical protein